MADEDHDAESDDILRFQDFFEQVERERPKREEVATEFDRVATEFDIPSDLVEYLKSVHSYIVSEHCAATTVVDDALQFDCCPATGGLYDKERWLYQFTYFPQFDEVSTYVKWCLKFDRDEIRDVAEGVMTKFEGWRCKDPDCELRFMSPDEYCSVCDTPPERAAEFRLRKQEEELLKQQNASAMSSQAPLSVVSTTPDVPISGDLARMQGRWRVVEGYYYGEHLTSKEGKVEEYVTIQGNLKIVRRFDRDHQPVRISLNEDTSPKQMIRHMEDKLNPFNGLPLPPCTDIYRFEGDRLVIVIAGESEADFEFDEHNDKQVLFLERVEEGSDET
ncbi:MAG: TIGR03067 domain-containing protein [Pirellulales bacterium]|nr:TIGR03067 domain-containing protein [Pirellulales bacterium]